MRDYRLVTPDMVSIVKGMPPCDDTGWWCLVVRDWCRAERLLLTDHRRDPTKAAEELRKWVHAELAK